MRQKVLLIPTLQQSKEALHLAEESLLIPTLKLLQKPHVNNKHTTQRDLDQRSHPPQLNEPPNTTKINHGTNRRRLQK